MKLNQNLIFTALILAATAAGAWAQTEVAANAAPSKGPAASAPAPAPPPITAADIQSLKDALAAQQLQIQALQAQLQSQNQNKDQANKDQAPQPVRTAALSVAPTATTAQTSPASSDSNINITSLQEPPSNKTTQNAGSSDERVRNLEREIKGLGPISFSGDVRLRAEPFFGGPTDQSLDRMRARVRARFNAIATLGEQFRAGLTLASGDINDPTSTNQTLTGFYTRKAIALDQAFVEFTPTAFKPLTLVGGKFRYPWYNTELTWDKDLNPEGVAETLAFTLDTPVLKRIAFIGFQLPFAEMAGTATTDKRITQSITYGGQLQTNWRLTSWMNLSAYAGYYDFRGARFNCSCPGAGQHQESTNSIFRLPPVDLREPGSELNLHHHSSDHRHGGRHRLSDGSFLRHQRTVRLEVRAVRHHRSPRYRYWTSSHPDFFHRRLRSEYRSLRQPSEHRCGPDEHRDCYL